MFEGNRPLQEAPIIKLTREEFDRIRNTPLTDMEALEVRKFQAEIGPLGLGLDRGIVSIEVDGEIIKMNTSGHDFGTVVAENQEDIPSGF